MTHSLEKLLSLTDRLLGPNGCPWDQKQTLFTLQPYLLEEMHELIEAIDSMDPKDMAQEWGDVLYTLIFIAKLAEKEKKFTFEEAIHEICNKLIRRHPHVFGDVKTDSLEEIGKNWEEIKKQEFKDRKNILDGIPASLPALPRAQKIIHKMKRFHKQEETRFQTCNTEEEFGQKLWEILEMADAKGWNAEDILRRTAARHEKNFRENRA